MKIRSDRGVTIIENFIAIVLIGIVVVPATVMAFSSSQRYIALARHHYRAACYAREALERELAGIAQRPVGELELDYNTGLTASAPATIDDGDGQNIIVTVQWQENIMASGEQANRQETVSYRRY